MKATLDNLVLRHVYCNSLLVKKSSLAGICRQLELPKEIIKPVLEELESRSSLTVDENGFFKLTELGRKQFTVVLTGGVFDLLHVGHVFTFQQAKLLGDILAVVITTDNWVEKLKNKRPTNPEQERALLVAHIKEIDVVVIGDEEDFMIPVDQIRPDFIALGYDQKLNEDDLKNQLTTAGYGHVKVVRLNQYVPNKSTSKIVQEILQRNIHQ